MLLLPCLWFRALKDTAEQRYALGVLRTRATVGRGGEDSMRVLLVLIMWLCPVRSTANTKCCSAVSFKARIYGTDTGATVTTHPPPANRL